jgi:hypothetical protein
MDDEREAANSTGQPVLKPDFSPRGVHPRFMRVGLSFLTLLLSYYPLNLTFRRSTLDFDCSL